MDAYQIVPNDEGRNPDELDIETFLRSPDRLPAINDLAPEIQTGSDPQQTGGLVVVPDDDDPMAWNIESLFADYGDSSQGTTTTMVVDQLRSVTQGYNGESKGKSQEQWGGPSSNYYYGTNSQSQSQDWYYYNGETSTQTGGFVLADGSDLSAWRPVQERGFKCACCQVLREIVHSNGEMVSTKLEIHGRVGMICHAILERRHYFTDRPVESHYQFIDYSKKCLEDVKHSLEEYCAEKEREGFFIEQDTLSAFYEAVCVGYDWNENLEDHSPTAFAAEPVPPLPVTQQQLPPREDNDGGRPPKTNLSQQRERAAKLKYKDLAPYFDYPIQEAARLLNLCPTVLKKVCRLEGVTRWPHRKVKSLKKQMEKVKDFMNTNVYAVEEYARLEESLNTIQHNLDRAVAGGKTVE